MRTMDVWIILAILGWQQWVSQSFGVQNSSVWNVSDPTPDILHVTLLYILQLSEFSTEPGEDRYHIEN